MKMTSKELLHYGTETLRRAGIVEAETDAWLLYSYVTGADRAQYYLHSAETVLPEWERCYREKIETRGRRVPLQQITGEQEFMGLPFSVNESVLIPRFDTEILVETLLAPASGKRVLDLCTGSGCIIISIAVLGNPECCVGVDISAEALQVARQNNRKLGGSVTFLESDLFEKVSGRFDLIVSNPPYIPGGVIQELMEEVRDYEPRIALDGGQDGLDFYRRIVRESIDYLSPEGILAFETGHDQGKAVMQLMEETGYSDICCRKDCAGHDRVVFGKYRCCQ